MLHFIWVFTVCQSTRFVVFSIQRVNLVFVCLQAAVSSGDLVITLGSCHTSVGGLDVNFHGGLLSSILDLLSRIFKDDMRSELEGVVSKHGILILFYICLKCSIKVILSGVIY